MSILPSAEHGYLPYFLFYAVIVGSTHTIVTYIFPSASQRQFSGERAPPRHALTAHVYGVKNFYTAMIRLYAAYNIHDPKLYNLAMLTWAGVLFLFSTELFIWHTVRVKEGWIPIATALVGLYWMYTQKEWYC